MVGKICMITYLNDDWEEDTWGIWISSGVFPCRGFSAVADDGQPGMSNLYINEDCCVEIDDRMYNCTVLAQLEEIDIPWLRQYMECVRVDDDDDPGEEFHVSRLWMWQFVEGLVQRGVIPKQALKTCKIHEREEAKKRHQEGQTSGESTK